MPEEKGTVLLRNASHMSVLNMILNLLSVAVKAAAGWLCGSTVLLSDAVHSAADSLSTVFVLSGLFFTKKHPGRAALCLQGCIILFLSFVILAAGGNMAKGGILILLNRMTADCPDLAAAFVAGGCALLKAVMFCLTRICAKRTDSPILYADACHHRADCFSSLLVLCSIAADRLQMPRVNAGMRLLLGVVLAVSFVSLFRTAVQMLRTCATDAMRENE